MTKGLAQSVQVRLVRHAKELGIDPNVVLARYACERLAQECRGRLPAYMVPAHISVRGGPLPRNQNGKLDRKGLAAEFDGLFREVSA